MQVGGREIEYLGNSTWHVDGQRASLASLGSDNLKIAATSELIEVSSDQASLIRAEYESVKAARRAPPVARRPAPPVTANNLSYHMYNRNGRYYG